MNEWLLKSIADVYNIATCWSVIMKGGLGQKFRPGDLALIQAIPYTHNKFWNMDKPCPNKVFSRGRGK